MKLGILMPRSSQINRTMKFGALPDIGVGAHEHGTGRDSEQR
jgi:hypothetical protein